LRTLEFGEAESDNSASSSTDDQTEEDFEFDFDDVVVECTACQRKILGFIYQSRDECRCSSCFHEKKGSRGDNFSRMRFPGDKRQFNTAVNGFDKENDVRMEGGIAENDSDLTHCWPNKEEKDKRVPNLFVLNFDQGEPFIAITTACLEPAATRQGQDEQHVFFEATIIELKDSENVQIIVGFAGKKLQRKGSASKTHSRPTQKWGWTLTQDEYRRYEVCENQDSMYTYVSGWKEGDVIGVLCNFQENLFCFYKNGIKDFRGDIRWTGKFDLFPFVEASNCKVEICFDYDSCQFKPLEFSVLPGTTIPFEIFEWKRPCSTCKSRLATHMYMCVAVDAACQAFVVCSACFHSGKDMHSECVDTSDKGEDACKCCKQPFWKHKMLGEKRTCPQDENGEVETVWTFQSPKVTFGQHESHLFCRINIPSDLPEFDDISSLKLVSRNNCEPLFGELWLSPVDPTSELRMKLLEDTFDSNSVSRKKMGVVVAIDSLCESGCTTNHSGFCVRCSMHFSFHRFGRRCEDDELSSDFGPNNDVCSRCSRSISDHHLVHLCLDDEIGRFHKDSLEQDLFISIEDKLYVEKISRVSFLVPDPGPHHHRQVAFSFVW